MANAILGHSNTSSLVEAEQELIDQLPTLMANQQLLINGVKMTVAQFLAPLQEHVTQAQVLNQKRGDIKGIVASQRQLVASNRKQMQGFKAFIASTFGTSSSLYITLKLARAPQSVTAAVKAEATVKRNATRKARGIVGKKQRKAIHATPAAAATKAG
jgi:hypothetical protein